jgi:minor extracellular serine protease Vpr
VALFASAIRSKSRGALWREPTPGRSWITEARYSVTQVFRPGAPVQGNPRSALRFVRGRARKANGQCRALNARKVSGKGVIIAILDRGIEWQNPDFINPDGTTRIKWLLDMTGQDWCNGNLETREYSAAQINQALRTGQGVKTRDAVGHGTVTAGIAAGNGRAYGNGIHHGVAPEADLIVVKLVSEGTEAHDDEPAEEAFHGCTEKALDWLDKKIGDNPAVGLINSGVQLWGPIDGTSIVNRQIDAVFGTRPGRIFVAPSGDEGALPNHAGGAYSNQETVVKLTRSSIARSILAMWFRGPILSIDLTFDDDGQSVRARTDQPGVYDGNGISLSVYQKKDEFYPVASNNGDHFVEVILTGHKTIGSIVLRGDAAATGRFDLYSDLNGVASFTDHLVPGRMTDLASTNSAIVVGAHMSTNTWTDIDGTTLVWGDLPGRLWQGSAGGPTRAGNKGIQTDLFAPCERCSHTLELDLTTRHILTASLDHVLLRSTTKM